ncbi:hypothetical protein O181_008644 [Austropuccinia psidii MF-1]|uniref:Uncharacterized protein n=1 Tax=Austropuccinia psidii MF-1 TaxID=1389203 RepID=A0A9Q3BMX0_9BASI|nr:hypothetical protein [Austropuccinia psidii MF-1]
MVHAIREKSVDDKDPREDLLVEYQEETQIEIQDIQLDKGMPQDPANKNLCKHTQDSKTFLVTPTKGMEYIHGTATKINLLSTKAKNFKSASGKMKSIGTIIKEIIIPHRKGNIILKPEFVVLDDAHIQGFLLGKDYQRIYGSDICNINTRQITTELLNECREGQFSTSLTSKQKLSLLKKLRKNRPAFAIGEEPLGKIRGHDIELYLAVEIPYPSMLRRPPYPESLETRKEIEKHINELLDIDVIKKIGQNEIVEITTPVLINWNEGKYRLCGYFRALKLHKKLIHTLYQGYIMRKINWQKPNI